MEHFAEQSQFAEMARKAEKALINAELRTSAAERAYAEAEKEYSASKQYRRNSRGRLVQSSLAAQEELAEEKDRLMEEVQMEKQALRDAQREVVELEQVISGQREPGKGELRSANNRSLAASGEEVDWDTKKECSRQNLADRVLSGWTMIPEYCSGRMCNFSPLLQDRNETHCVICEGSGNGEDGAYAGDDNNDDYSVTMSYAAKKSKYDNLNQNSEKVDFPRDRTSASKEVGRRIL